VHHECQWCSEENNSTAPIFRCSTISDDSCPVDQRQNPRSSVEDTENKDFTDQTSGEAIQLRPQKMKIKLRPGNPVTVNINFKKTVEYPLDLYYVMDLSNSMSDDLQTLKGLGDSLVRDIKRITSNVHLGFGSFVDKVMMPYASTVTEHLKNPCDKGVCSPVFGFKHQLSITEDGEKFKDAVENTTISGNIDSPEGGFDALMQIAVCQSTIGWRDDALRVILYASDASPHIALDGKLAAILESNDKQCHLQKGYNKYLPDDIVYSKSKELDYPSVGQLRDVFRANKIQTIFAVTAEVYPLYVELTKVLGKDKNFHGQLASDSKNVINIIEDSYNELKSIITLNLPTVPDNVEMQYRVKCPGSTDYLEGDIGCNNAGNIDDEVQFQFTFNAKKCPDDTSKKDQLIINSANLKDETIIDIEYECECACSADQVDNSDKCSEKGTYDCGSCICGDGFTGKSCQCEVDSAVSFDDQCKQTLLNGKSGPICSGSGYCECGECQCYNERFGTYCECINSGCSGNNEGECGGPDKGDCQNCNNNKECKCKNGYTLNENTKLCTCNTLLCKAGNNASLPECNSNGNCKCDKCDCNTFNGLPGYEGAFCEECIHPECKELKNECSDNTFKSCATCVYDSIRTSQDPEERCEDFCKGVSYKTFDTLPDCTVACSNTSSLITDECKLCENLNVNFGSDLCEERINDIACDVKYRIVWDIEQKDYFLYIKKFDQLNDCDQPINPLYIVFPVVGAILLIGIILLIVWKMYTHFRDKVEYKQFLEDQKKSRWTQGENPLFNKASVRVENPAFIGK